MKIGLNMQTKNKRFKRIGIVSSNYKITYHKELKDEKGELIDGDIWETRKEIKVLNGMPYQRILQVIMHESMHGIRFELPFNPKDDENTTILLTTGVTCFIRDNQEFIIEYMRVLNQ